jgi:pimeloyl-ACP methyl ester carboxylesterase
MSTWILLRGLARERRHWGTFPEQLMGALPDACLVTLDLPGNGDLNAMTTPTSISEMAAHCRAEMKKLGVPPPYNLLAISMGGMVATEWAEGHPDEIHACVLINTSFGSFSPPQHRMRPGVWPILPQLLLAGSAQRRERIIFRLTSRLAQASDELIGEWTAIRTSQPVSVRNTWRQLIAAARFQAPSVAPVASLVLAGAGDRLVDPRCSMDIARRWKCAIAIHPSAGHDLPLDDGAWVAEQIRSWLAMGLTSK